MQYSDLFPKPITECSDEEIIARVTELREKNSLPKFSALAKEKKEKAPTVKKLSKAEQMMQAALELSKIAAVSKES